MNEELAPMESTTYEGCGLEISKWDTAKTLEEAAKRVNLSVERLSELADKRLCPHYRVDGKIPMFNVAALRAWMAENLVEIIPGKPLPLVEVQTVVLQDPRPSKLKLPECLRSIHNIREATFATQVSGVYFLCHGMECVYVGQASHVSQRVGQHTDKVYDMVYYVYVHPNNLDEVERELILALLPKYNNCGTSRKARRQMLLADIQNIQETAP